jgi:arabinogalactan oligomer / maltooligosaccharide transport system substrate-binding protein
MSNICPNCGKSTPPDQPYCTSCNAPLARSPRTMREAWEAARLRKSLASSGMWSILWGVMGVITGIALLEDSDLNIILIGIGVFLIGTGIAAWAAPRPTTLRLDAAALLLVGVWNIITTIANADSEQFVWAIAGVIQIVWSIQRFRKHGDFVRVQHVSKSLAREVEALVNGTQKARVARDERTVEFRADSKLWKARLMADMVIATANNTKEVRFVVPDAFLLAADPEAAAGRWVKANVKLGHEAWSGTASPVSIERYRAWRAARDGTSEEPAPVESAPAAPPVDHMPAAPGISPPVVQTVSEHATPASSRSKPRLGWLKWAAVGMSVVLLLCAVAGFFAYRVLGQRAFERGETAYREGDVEEACPALDRVATVYALSGASYVQEAKDYQRECAPIVTADTLFEEEAYDRAVEAYQTYLDGYAQGPFVPHARAGIQEAYVGWSEALVGEGHYLQALEALGEIYAAYEDGVVPAAIETAYEAALFGLAGDDGEDGKNVIAASWKAICEGGKATSQAVGLLSGTSAGVWYKGSKLKLPAAMVSTQPGHLRYAICLEEELSDVQSCRYMPAGVVKRQKIAWRVIIRDTLTGELVASTKSEGGEPKKCPPSWTFVGKSLTGTLKGTSPDNAAIVDWLGSVLEAKLPVEMVEIEPPKPTTDQDADPEPTRAGSSTPTATQIRLSIYTNWENEDLEALEMMLDRYHDLYPKVSFELNHAREQELIETVLAAGEADLVLWSGLDIPRWAENGSIVSLSAYADVKWVREQYIDAAAETVIHNGEVYGLPVRAMTMAMLYNRALLSKEDVPRTTDDLFEQARAWTETSAYFAYEPKIYFFSAGWFHGGEAWFMSRDCEPNLDVPDGVAAAELIAAFREIMPEKVDYGMADQMFRGGEIAITLNGPWVLPTMENDGIDYGVVSFPTISATGSDPAPYVDPAVWMVTNQAQRRGVTEAAWNLIRFLASAESQRSLAQERFMIPTVRAAGEEGWFGDQEGLAVFYAQAERGAPMPPSTCSAPTWNEANNMLTEIWEGADPAQAVADAQAALEKAVADLK